MAKQRITPGGTLDVPTEEELARMFSMPKPNVIVGMGGSTDERIVDDIPMRGTRRQLTSHNRGNGADGLVLQPATLTDVCELNPSRIAGTLTNIGANPVYVYLGKASRVLAQGNPGGNVAGGGVICGYLFPNSAWDFKLTNDVWCGPVSAFSVLGSTLVWGVH